MTDAEDRDRFRRVMELFDRVIALSPEERRNYLGSLSVGEKDLETEVRALVQRHEDEEGAFGEGQLRISTPTPALRTVLSELTDRSSPPKRVGQFRILEKLGEGGMGVVYLAESEASPRDRGEEPFVALKLIRPGLNTREILSRFESERQALARMNHPGIARVLTAGETEEGHPYFVMEFVDGLPLTKFCDRKPCDLQERLQLFLKICDAVQHAHQKSVLHRDLKPQNILVEEIDGVPEPKIIDFGIAKALEGTPADRVSWTRPGRAIGTPNYMSPEQATGSEDVDTRSDLYSLGVLLHELLVGRLPFGPNPPGRKASRSELDWIVLKALEREPSRRYATVSALVDDLERTLRGEPIQARPPSWTYRVLKSARQHRALLTGTVLCCLLLVLAASLSISAAYRSAENARAADLAARRARGELGALERLADMKRLKDSIETANTLFPPHPKMVPSMVAWLKDAKLLAQAYPRHRYRLATLDRTEPSSEEPWQRRILTTLVADLERYLDPDPSRGTLASVEERLRWARAVRKTSIEDRRSEWNRAISSIANTEESPLYRGLEIKPQVGLVPLGKDPETGLWEFGHLRSGELASRGKDGVLIVNEETGLVFVLLPGGSFSMGAQRPSSPPASAPRPFEDPLAMPQEGPAHPVNLSPFFVSKYEMTQGQWLRVAGENPSHYRPTPGFSIDLRHPVENVSWRQSVSLLRRLALTLPTEAQWEYAARGGTTTRWWTGRDRETLVGAANLADQAARRAGAPYRESYADWPEFDDGFPDHAPVDALRKNGFGLHHVHGNVWEWVRDGFVSYSVSPRPGDGFREGGMEVHGRVTRGGAFDGIAMFARVTHRDPSPAEARFSDLGVRPAREIE